MTAMVNAINRRQQQEPSVQQTPVSTRRTRSNPIPLVMDATEPTHQTAAHPRLQNRRRTQAQGDRAVARPLVRPGRIQRQADHVWEETTFIPLPYESTTDEAYEQDLIADERGAMVAGQLDYEGELRKEVADEPLFAPRTNSEIIEEQRSDEFCQSVLRTQVGRNNSPFFEGDDGVLCRQNPLERHLIQVVLPASLHHRLMRLAHYHKLAGHPGQTRLQNRLRRSYYWPQMSADSITTISECTSCAKNRIRLLKQVSKMKLFPAERPLKAVAIDILGPLPQSKAGFLFILVINDRFSK